MSEETIASDDINATFPLTESGAFALRTMLLAYGAIVEATP